ncbi:hypothetical protein Patl1_31255 [Pistacia atlantica]|uniref:Uncharacterized protein n=1 Tax=Pistacia atlantica TaxID=434234 RepID=A0ACC1AB64_9ROSI|nr:hypothetical protein Patl1_31255 [Pistacia atlantica]
MLMISLFLLSSGILLWRNLQELGAILPLSIHAPGMKQSLRNAYVNGKRKVSKLVVQSVVYHLDKNERS